MRYPYTYLINHDIDWFCIVNGVYIHVASAGGQLPSLINDDDSLKNAQYQVELLPDIYSDEEIEYNEEAINNALGINGEKGRYQYVESFTAMARKGFASFDRTNIANPQDNHYHLVCKPKNMNRRPENLELLNIDISTFAVLLRQGGIDLGKLKLLPSE